MPPAQPSSLVYDHVQDLTTKVKTQVQDDLVYAYDLADLVKQGKDLAYPFVAVVYAGMFPNSDDRTQEGYAQNLRFMIHVVAGGKELTLNAGVDGVQHKANVNVVLDRVRNVIVGTTAPSRKKWRCKGEVPQDYGNDIIGFVQIWEVPALIGGC